MDFQRRVKKWMAACFPPGAADNANERTHRFLEEALELAQANGCSRDDALALVNYVFARPTGNAALEAGGVLVTLAGLCSATDIDLEAAGEAELARNWDRIDAIRAKRAARPENSPLPQ
ncbi:hypothetical protein [Devosia sp. A16]|uniref:hypothetical protein n=1 Tax=Devosia sp. A16 TaxID=1736675 RepID=UPI0006D7B0FF|nr:hypothetical protein [Devosia sp. A16]